MTESADFRRGFIYGTEEWVRTGRTWKVTRAMAKRITSDPREPESEREFWAGYLSVGRQS